MKNLFRTTAMKTLCFILCILMLALTAASAVGAVAMSELGFYTNSEESLIRDVQHDLVSSDSNNIVYTVLADYKSYDSYLYSRESTNIRYLVTDNDGSYIDSNLDHPPERSDSCWQYRFVRELGLPSDYDYPNTMMTYNVYVYLEEGLPVQDEYVFYTRLIQVGYAMRYWIYAIGLGALLLAVLCYTALLRTAGRRPKSENLYPGPLYKVPFDLLTAISFGLLLLGAVFVDELRFGYSDVAHAIALALLATSVVCAFVGLSMSLAVRIKARNLLKNTVIYKAYGLLRTWLKALGRLFKRGVGRLLPLVRSLPVLWRTLAVLAVLTAVDLLLLVLAFDGYDITVFLWLIKAAVLVVAGLYASFFMRKLQQGGTALAQGDLDFRVDTSMMYWDFKQHGENLNSISLGMSAAVEERLRSERMKTELITNVSHDIKTPLTSIINYATLIAEEACDHDTHAEYAQVLVRKSEHLKRLLDDLVEASKASTGNLEVALAPCEAGVLLTQADGEFQQRCQAAGLELITSQPEGSVRIMADSRRIWRVFENLMSNICKYSLPGSRVFLSLKREGGEAVFTFRNTTNTVLNISADELMERFVRGDTARSTEGSGLGLSIARSLTELQNGKMHITIDGDLFKVTLHFPILEG